jgi:hypothetical protein
MFNIGQEQREFIQQFSPQGPTGQAGQQTRRNLPILSDN